MFCPRQTTTSSRWYGTVSRYHCDGSSSLRSRALDVRERRRRTRSSPSARRVLRETARIGLARLFLQRQSRRGRFRTSPKGAAGGASRGALVRRETQVWQRVRAVAAVSTVERAATTTGTITGTTTTTTGTINAAATARDHLADSSHVLGRRLGDFDSSGMRVHRRFNGFCTQTTRYL